MVYARFPLSFDVLRTPRLAIRNCSWSFCFSEISRLDASDATRYVLVRFGALGCNMATIGQVQMTRSRYDQIRSDRLSPTESTIWSRSDKIIKIGLEFPIRDDPVRADTFRYDHHAPIRYVAIGYDCGRDVFHDQNRE